MNLKKSLTENIGVKLIALVVAMFIWAYASGQKEAIWLKMIPIVLENVSDSLVVSGNIPAEAEISVTGTKRQLILTGFKRMSLSVNLAGAVPGRQRISLSSRNIRLPGGIDRRSIRILEPTTIDLNLELLVTRRAQVTLATTGVIPQNLVMLAGAFSITPSWVYIKGAASEVDRIETVTTIPLDLSKLKESVEREVMLDIGSGRFGCQPDRVKVAVRLSPKRTRILANVPPTVLVDSEDLDATVFPSTVSLTLEGAAAFLDTISSGDVSVLLNLSGKDDGIYKLPPEIILPPGVVLTAVSVDSLVVSVKKGQNQKSP